MSYKIIGNTEYKSINEKAYINGSQDDIMRLAQELDRVGINYSGRISEYRSAITVAAADRVKAIEIMNGLMRKDESSLANAEKNIIGNVEYRYIANKRYIKGETEAMLRTADRLTAENIPFSGRVNGNTVTLTVSGDEMQERVKKYFSEEINREQTIQSVYLLSPASDGYEDGYYISEVNANTGEEISPYRSSYGDIPMFVSVDEAILYTQNAGIALSNTEAQFAEWRKAEEEKEHQLLLERSREIIRQLPMSGKEYEEHFIFRDNAIDWIYFNPDGNDSEGEFVETTIYAADIINAYKERVASSDAENGRNNFLETIIHSCEQKIIEAGTEDFESYAHHFIETSEENNVFKTFGIYENSDYIQNIDTVINRLENHFEEVRSYTENVVEQLYELAQKELEDFENSLDTAEKAKAAAYELSVKRDILSYIHSDLSNDISDSDTEDACRRLISSGYPLDTFYQDWLKNEYDNRTEAIKMTAADSLRRETQYFGIIENAKEFAHNAGLPFRYDPNEEPSEDFDQYSINSSMSIEDYELMHKLMKEDRSEEKAPVDQNKSNTLIVNIYGGPGAGKSTTALQLVAELKKRGFHSEYISEVAKEYVYAKNFDVLNGSLKNQKQIFSEQQHRQDLMIGNVDVAITDAPLLLNTIYTNSDEITLEYSSHIMDEYNKYNNYNIYINRDLSVKFENEGRIHNLSESIEKDGEIKSMLIKNSVIFDEFDRDNISEIADKIVEKLPYYEKNNEAIPHNKTNTDLITITCNFSESAAFEDGKTYSVAEFDRIMANADVERVNGWKNGLKKYGNENIWEYNDSESYYKYIGYDKTSFTINFPNGETISERQDIGDGYGGVIDYFRSFSSLQKFVPILEKQRDLDNAVRERDEAEQKAAEFETEKENNIDDNNIKSEQLSFFSTTPSRQSIDEAFSELSTPPEEKRPENTSADFTIVNDDFNSTGGAKARYENNVAAIRLLKAIESEDRTATPEEQRVLAKYVGWGGIANAFDSRKDDWSKEYNELKNLLTDEEYRAARASTMNAHYTSPTVIKAIYNGLANIGFEGGKILEPAMGTGNFFGAMPDTVRSNSELYGVELDSITGRIAKQLYPSANIQIKGYEQTSFENNSFDVAIGNVPFGGYKVNDADYNKHNFFIHDYFFAKTLDKVRPGGVVAFVTSQGTLDKSNPEIRKYLAERAELLGAIRLPNNAFKANAGTEVTSDIIFLQKRERPIRIEENTPEWVYKDMLPNGIAVNKYFTEHPEMILGEMVEGNKMYGNQSDSSMCVPIEGKILADQLSEAVKNITGAYHKSEISLDNSSTLKNSDEVACPPNTPKYSFVVMDDVLYYHKSSNTMEKYKAPEKNREQIKAMVQLRDSIHQLLELQLENTNGQNDTAILEAQNALNAQYDNFSEQYGRVSSQENKILFRDDNSYHLIKSLEKFDKDGNFIGKADIFSKNTINPRTVVDHCDNAQDALILSLSEKMCVNFEYMSQLTGKSEAELIEELGDKIFQNPQKYMRWESADEYLTGNIRTKLAAAEAAGLTRNAEALRAVMPKRIEAADISVKLSSAWIAPEYIKEFIVETLKPDFYTSRNIEVTYMQATDKWKIENWRSAYSNTLATETYGTHDINAYEIIEATLNMQKVEIRERVKDELGNYIRDKNGRYVYELNQQKTMIAQSKQDDLKRKFSEWIFADPNRREKLVDIYNENFNSVRLREYDGSHLNFVGMNSDITLKEHQKNAVARGLYSNGNTLLAHEVGSGKTFEMIAIAMEGKRLGLHNKPLITAPNGLTEQWGNAFRQLYPSANVLVATEKDFQKENRRDLFAKIATGDWDAVVIGHSQFDMIHLSRDRELNMLNSELDRLEAALSEMIDENGKKGFSVKQIEKAMKSYQDKIEKLLAKTPEDDMLCFEKLGIDKLFVDESQAYKNLDTPTKMRNVSGIGSGGSGRAMQLLMKCKYLDELTGGKGCVFASGTPISNSMSEMYTLMRYLQADKLEEMGINSFDRWASVFGETVSSMELSPEGNGKYQMKTRFAKFQNLPELMNIFKETADIKTADTLNLDRPDFEMHNVNVPATAIQASMIKELGQRAKEIRSGNVDPTEDNMCKLTVDGRKIGLDQRCINPNLPDDPKSKVNVCINNVFDIWQKTSAEKSTQLIFCDLATPQPTLNENTYSVYRPNIDNGYSKVFTAKLNEKDTAEKIMKKLNGSKPPKNYDAGEIADGDIIMLKRINYEEEKAYNTAFEVVNGKLTEVSPETWEKLHHAPIENFASERKYCVYDDIKQKLIAKGVPEKEIAFIHDVDKAEEKQALYDKMNKGEIRVLIGSTFKCGAGMNAQERMIALHDLDAPMRPSDMEQRHGRIIRQGNTNSKVDIYRYTTDKTFDAYLYQMLENKQKFISQIMTDKSPVRSCEDVDEVALDYAEVKALCAGNPLIKEKIDLETEITKLNVIKSAFLSQKYSLQDKAYKALPEQQTHTEKYITKLKSDLETVHSVKPLTNEDGKNYYPIVINGKEYHDKEEAGNAIRQAIMTNGKFMENKECTIGSYRGFELKAFIDTHFEMFKVKVNLRGACNHYGDINMDNNVKASGNIVRLDNIINGIDLELQKQEDHLQSINADIKEAREAAEAVFPQEAELSEKEKRLAQVNSLLTNSDIRTDHSTELYAALVEICPELENYDSFNSKYEKDEDSEIEPLIIEKNGNNVFIAHIYTQNGDLMYDPAIEFSFDTKNHRAEVTSYQLDGMGIFEDFSDGTHSDMKTDVEEMALDTLFENIKSYNYDRTVFNAENNSKETGKENSYDFAR